MNDKTMKCREIERLIGLEADGMATAQQVAAVEAHGAECGACARERRELRAYRRTMDVLFSALEAPPLAAAFEDGLARRSGRPGLGERVRRFFRSRPLARIALSALALFVVVAVTVKLQRPGAADGVTVAPRVAVEDNRGVLLRQALCRTENARIESVVQEQTREILTYIL